MADYKTRIAHLHHPAPLLGPLDQARRTAEMGAWSFAMFAAPVAALVYTIMVVDGSFLIFGVVAPVVGVVIGAAISTIVHIGRINGEHRRILADPRVELLDEFRATHEKYRKLEDEFATVQARHAVGQIDDTPFAEMCALFEAEQAAFVSAHMRLASSLGHVPLGNLVDKSTIDVSDDFTVAAEKAKDANTNLDARIKAAREIGKLPI